MLIIPPGTRAATRHQACHAVVDALPPDFAIVFTEQTPVFFMRYVLGHVIAHPDGTAFVNPTGNPGMASGGTGDILTGVIAALAAQGCDLETAASLGVCLHARAGDLAAAEGGERGVLATDLLPHLRRLVNP